MKDDVICIEDMMVQSVLHFQFCAGLALKWESGNIEPEIRDLFLIMQRKYGIRSDESSLNNDIVHRIFPQSLFLEQLFTLLILPTEKHFERIPDDGIMLSDWGVSQLIPENKCGIRYILKRIRNALVHNHFQMSRNSRDSAFIFFDSNSRKKCTPDNNEFRIDFSSLGLKKFIDKSGEHICNNIYD